ncbi:MAG TPA: hypothetical protein VII75_16560, partial [Thermoanaerobaculia bacterium]
QIHVMRYHNPESGLRIDLNGLDADRKRFYHLAIEQLHANVDWLEFEGFAFSFGSPIFKASHDRQEVLTDPLFLVLKDIWLRLGIRQGMVAPSKEIPTRGKARESRQAGSHIAAHRSDMAIADKPSVPARRRR